MTESQQWQIDNGLIPAPGVRAKARALNAKKKRNAETSVSMKLYDKIQLIYYIILIHDFSTI